MNEKPVKPFVYQLSSQPLEITLTEDGFTVFGHKVSHRDMWRLGSMITQCERVLSAHGIHWSQEDSL